jgi:hypothetical protein
VHCMLAVSTATSKNEPLSAAGLDAAESVLMGRRFVRPLRGVYIVAVDGQGEWRTLLDELTEAAKGSADDSFSFVISPPIDPGVRYNGLIPKGFWTKINELSDE